MSQGLLVTNTSGQTIVSDYTKTFHLAGKISPYSIGAIDITNFPNYGSTNDALDGRTIFYYTITATTEPLVFIKPQDYSRFYGLIRKYNSGNTWYFEVMASGTSTPSAPYLYCFVEPAGITSSPDSTHGLVVYKSNGETTFDSRYSPLAISGGGLCVPPSDPTDSAGLPGTSSTGWNYATLDHDFRSTTRYNSYSIPVGSDLMFSTPSLAQATCIRRYNGYKKSCGYGVGCQEHWSTALWWVMYRSLFRLRTNGYFDAGWGPYYAGYHFSSRAESGGWFGGGSKYSSYGSAPYAQKTINLFSNMFLIASSSAYD